MQDQSDFTSQNRSDHDRLILAAILLLGLLIRLPFIGVDFHTTVDVGLYRHWARLVHMHGLAAIYDGTDVDYPPLLLYVFGCASLVEAGLPASLRAGDYALTALVKLPAILADVFTVGLIAWVLRRQAPALRILACAAYAFNPAIWYVSAHWGQTDSVYTLLLVISVAALAQGAVLPAWAAYVLALGTKPQSIALAPLLFTVTLMRYGVRKLAAALALAAIVGAILAAPWLITGRIGAVLRLYTLPDKTPKVDVSAYNLWYLLRLGDVHNVSSMMQPASLPLSYQEIGIGLCGMLIVVVVGLIIWRGAGGLALPAALLSMGLFMLLTQMHERYLFPTLAFLLLSAAEASGESAPDAPRIVRPGLWWAYGVITLTFLFNLITIAPFTPALGTNLVAPQPDPDSARVVVLKALSLVAAAANTFVLAWLLAALARIKG